MAPPEDGLRELGDDLNALASSGAVRHEFVRLACERLAAFFRCDLVEVAVGDGTRWGIGSLCEGSWRYETIARAGAGDLAHLDVSGGPPELELPAVVRSLDTGEEERLRSGAPAVLREGRTLIVPLGGRGPSLGLLMVRGTGLLGEEVAGRAGSALRDVLTHAFVHATAHAALREREKELACLYALARLTELPDITVEAALQRAVELLPPAWQYPDVARCRIVLDGRQYTAASGPPGAVRQAAPIRVDGEPRGFVEVSYTLPCPELDEGPFLSEERNLIDAVAAQLARFVERRMASREHGRLRKQLLHADRLATIGQLAAGVAHELNEPLASILGFAQLAAKCPGVPEPALRDLDKLVDATLSAREIIKKLMVFSRQTTPRIEISEIAPLIDDSLFLLEARCARQGIEVVRELVDGIPPAHLDRGQITQVLVNLVVNAIQAMPDGGRLTVGVRAEGSDLVLRVEDTGCGMAPDVAERIFLPFFTTKDVHQGTGLGLAVTHGIVEAHGGRISVHSRPGEGSAFAVRIPIAGPALQWEDADGPVR